MAESVAQRNASHKYGDAMFSPSWRDECAFPLGNANDVPNLPGDQAGAEHLWRPRLRHGVFQGSFAATVHRQGLPAFVSRPPWPP